MQYAFMLLEYLQEYTLQYAHQGKLHEDVAQVVFQTKG